MKHAEEQLEKEKNIQNLYMSDIYKKWEEVYDD